MKKILFAVLVAMIATSCNQFKSVEKPIEGCDYVTYTAQGTPYLGIKQAGEQGKILTQPLYVQALYRHGYFVTQMPGKVENVKWQLLDSLGKQVIQKEYNSIASAPDYYVLDTDDGKYFLKNGEKNPIGPNEDYYYQNGKVFFKNDGKWGLDGALQAQWEKILVLKQDKSEDIRLVVKTPNKVEWFIYDASGKLIKKTTAAKVKQMETNSKKFESQKWGNDNCYGRSVANVKAY